MLYVIIFLCIIIVLSSIFIGFILFKGYALLKDYKKNQENLAQFHSRIKELEDGIIQPVQNNLNNNKDNSTLNQKYNLPTPKIILDNKTYSEQEFSKEINRGNFQMSSMLQSKLYKKE